MHKKWLRVSAVVLAALLTVANVGTGATTVYAAETESENAIVTVEDDAEDVDAENVDTDDADAEASDADRELPGNDEEPAEEVALEIFTEETDLVTEADEDPSEEPGEEPGDDIVLPEEQFMLVVIDGDTYCVDGNGRKIRGFCEVDGNLYYFDDQSGVMFFGGFFRRYGLKYYADEQGVIAEPGWLMVHNSDVDMEHHYISYYVLKNRAIACGVKLDIYGYYYIFDDEGVIRTGLIKFEDDWYYAYPGGSLAVNTWITNGEEKYYAFEDGKLAWADKYGIPDPDDPEAEYIFDSGCCVMYGIVEHEGELYYCTPKIAKNTWIEEDEGTSYATWDGTFAASEMLFIDNGLYIFDDYAYLIKNKVTEFAGNLYFSHENGRVAINQWATDGEDWYYAFMDGCLARDGKYEINGNDYIFGHDGAVMSGFVFHDGEVYYCKPQVAKNEWIIDDEGTMYAKNDGPLAFGEIVGISGGLFIFDDDGYVIKNKITVFEGEYYYCYQNGRVAQNQWVKYNGYSYYALSDGKLARDGMYNIDGDDYIFGAGEDNDCGLMTGFVHYNGELYYCHPKVAKNLWIYGEESGDRCYAKSDGVLAHDEMVMINGNIFIFDHIGEVLTGFIEFGGKRYYASTNGKVARNQLVTRTKGTFWAETDGHLVTNEKRVVNAAGAQMIFSGSGAAQKGLVNFQGTDYVVKIDYTIAKNRLYTIDGKTYYAQSDGSAAKSTTIELNGMVHVFDANGVCISTYRKAKN